MTKRATASLTLFLLAACPAAAAPASEAAPADAADKPAADHAPAAIAEAEVPSGDHDGCIYAAGEDPSENEKLGCPGGDDEPVAAGTLGLGDGHYGAEFSLAKTIALRDAVGEAGDAPQLVEGEVEAVCQKKGCWMVIKDGTVSARVLMKDHGFAVPMDCRGKKAIVEGTISSRTFTEAQVKHLAKDGGKDPAEVSGTRTEHVLTASAVKIVSRS